LNSPPVIEDNVAPEKNEESFFTAQKASNRQLEKETLSPARDY